MVLDFQKNSDICYDYPSYSNDKHTCNTKYPAAPPNPIIPIYSWIGAWNASQVSISALWTSIFLLMSVATLESFLQRLFTSTTSARPHKYVLYLRYIMDSKTRGPIDAGSLVSTQPDILQRCATSDADPKIVLLTGRRYLDFIFLHSTCQPSSQPRAPSSSSWEVDWPLRLVPPPSRKTLSELQPLQARDLTLLPL